MKRWIPAIAAVDVRPAIRLSQRDWLSFTDDGTAAQPFALRPAPPIRQACAADPSFA